MERSRPKAATRASTSTSSRSSRAIRCEHMLEEIRREVADFRIHVDTWRRQAEIEQEVPAVLPRLDTYEAAGNRCGRARARTATTRTARSCVPTTAPTCTSPPTSPTCATSSSAASTAPSTCSAPTTTATSPRLKAAAAMLGYDPERIEVLIYQLVHIVEGGETKKISKRRGDVVFLRELVEKIGVDAARWYLVSRGPRPADRHRRRPRRRAHAEEPGLLRAVRACAHRRDPAERRQAQPSAARLPARARARGARPDQAAGGLSGSRRRGGRAARAARDPDLRDPRRRRLSPLLPRAPSGGIGDGGVPARRSCRATQRVIARCLDLVGVEAPERM